MFVPLRVIEKVSAWVAMMAKRYSCPSQRSDSRVAYGKRAYWSSTFSFIVSVYPGSLALADLATKVMV